MRGNQLISNVAESCTTGFVAIRNGTNERGVTTAGHCPNGKLFINSVPHTVKGDINAGIATNPKGIDIQFMTANNVNYVPEMDYSNVVPGTNLRVLGEIFSFGIPDGTFICAVGRRGLPAKQCGTYIGEKETNFRGVDNIFPAARQTNSTSTNSFTQGGDSGGPVYIELLGLEFFGIGPSALTLGTIVGNDLGENGILYFSPMEKWSVLGIKLALD